MKPDGAFAVARASRPCVSPASCRRKKSKGKMPSPRAALPSNDKRAVRLLLLFDGHPATMIGAKAQMGRLRR